MSQHNPLIADRNLTLMLTYRCNAQCAECGTFSSPHDKNDIALETALASIDWGYEAGLRQVVFTGGEATLRWDDLLACLRRARELGMGTRLVTNAQWAPDLDSARRGIAELIAAGMDEINYSTGDEHVRFIPLDYIVYAIQAAVEAEITTVLMFELRAKSKVNEAELVKQIAASAPPDLLQKHFAFLRSPWMPIRPDNIEEYPDGLYATRDNVAFRKGCDSILSNYVVQGTGKIAPCCGLGMRSIPELQIGTVNGEQSGNPVAAAIKEAESDLFLFALHKIGPEKIVAWAAQKDPTIQWENMYAHRCQACMRIYRDPKVKQVIIDHMQELMAEMLYGGYVLRKFEQLAADVKGTAATAEKDAATPDFVHYV